MIKPILLILALFTLGNATKYYVSQNTAGARDTVNNGSLSTPWKTAWYGMKQLHPGDTLYIRSGTYQRYTGDINGSDRWNMSNRFGSGAAGARDGTPEQPILVTSYPNEYPILLSGLPGDTATIGTDPRNFLNPALGPGGYDHWIFDNLKVYGCISLQSTDSTIGQNCEIWGGGDGEFGACIRPEYAYNCIIRNNIIHDNSACTPYPDQGPGPMPLIEEYDSRNLVIEHNTLYNSAGIGVYLKDSPNGATVRYNHIKSCLMGISAANQGNVGDTNKVWFHNNIIEKCTVGIGLTVAIQKAYMYNNTISNAEWAFSMGTTDGVDSFDIYNNVVFNTHSYKVGTHWIITSVPSQYRHARKLDYNCWQASGVSFWTGQQNISTVAGFAYWLDSLSYTTGRGPFETHSIDDNPLFVDTSISNFKLQAGSPCINAGIDWQDYDNDGNTTESINIGAYITGNEVIGYTDYSGYDTVVCLDTLKYVADPSAGYVFTKWHYVGNGVIVDSLSDTAKVVPVGVDTLTAVFTEQELPTHDTALYNQLANPSIDTIRVDTATFNDTNRITKPIRCKVARFKSNCTVTSIIWVQDSIVYDAPVVVTAGTGAQVRPYIYPSNKLYVRLNSVTYAHRIPIVAGASRIGYKSWVQYR